MNLKRSLIFVIVAILVMTSCEQPTNDDSDNANVQETLYTGTDSDGNWEIEYTKETNGNVITEIVRYILTIGEGDRQVGFAVIKDTADNTTIYKGSILLARTSGAFSTDYYNHHYISLGQNNLYMDNAIGATSESDGWYIYGILGGLSGSDVDTLTAATLLTISLSDSTSTNAPTQFSLPTYFQTALLSKL